MLEMIPEYGLVALFLVSFLAATLLPLGSEWLLITLILNGSNPAAAVITATVGNSLGSATNYLIGYYGRDWLRIKLLHVDEGKLARATRWFDRYGSWSLLLAWLPVVGDPLCLVSGMMKTSWLKFSLLVVTGKGLRYLSLALMTLRGAEFLA